jgi:hypothetical protein
MDFSCLYISTGYQRTCFSDIISTGDSQLIIESAIVDSKQTEKSKNIYLFSNILFALLWYSWR